MKLKKIVAKILVFTTLITSIKFAPVNTLTIYAFNNNAGGGAFSAGGGKGLGGSGVRTLESQTSGVRMTLIDPKTGETMSKSIDILFSSPGQPIDMFIGSRVENALKTLEDSPKDEYGYPIDWSAYSATWIAERLFELHYDRNASMMPMWYNRSGKLHTGTSDAFKNWFCPDTGLAQLSGIYTALNVLSNELNKANEHIEDANNASTYGEEMNAKVAATQSINNASNVLDNVKKKIGSSLKTASSDVAYQAIRAYADYYKAGSLAKEHVWVDKQQFKQTYEEYVSNYNLKWPGEAATYGGFEDTDTILNSIITTDDTSSGVTTSNNDLNTKNETLLAKLDNLLTLTVYAAPTDERDPSFDKIQDEEFTHTTRPSNIDDTITEASGAGTVEMVGGSKSTGDMLPTDFWLNESQKIINTSVYGYACPLLTLEQNGVSIFAKHGESGEEMRKLFTNGNAYFCVEPILFFQAQTTSNYPRFFYGTVKNYAAYSQTTLASWDGLATGGGNIFRGPNVAFPGAFALHRNEGYISEEDRGLAFDQNQRTPFLESEPYLFGEYAPMTYGGRYSVDGARYRAETLYDWTVSNVIGLGMHLYCVGNPGSSSIIDTYDIVNKPKWDDNSEPAPGKPDENDEYIEKKKNKTFQIAKFYRIKIGNEYIERSYYSQTNTPHTINITDEVDIGWKLTDWFTSPSEWLPPDGKDPEEYPWEGYVRGNNPLGTYEGTEEQLLIVQPDDPDNTLYLLYELELGKPPSDNSVTVIRVYDDEDGHTDKVEREVTEDNPYIVPDGEDYDYVETKITPNSPNDTHTWNDSEGDSQGSPTEIRYPEGTKTIYIHYIKKPVSPETKKIILWENELSYNYDLRDLLKERKLIGIYDNVPWPGYMWKSCGGHSCGGSRCRGRHKCTNRTKGLSERKWTVAVQDTFDENTLPFIKDWTYISEMSKTGRANDEGGNGKDATVTPQATYLLIRNKQDDVVTLYPGKNSSLLSELSQLNLSENYTSSDTRYEKKRETDKTEKYYRTLHTGLAYGAGRDTEMTWWTLLYGSYGSHSNSGKFYSSPLVSPDDANAAYSKENNVETRYFLGQAGKGEEEPSDIRSSWNKKFSRNTSYAKTSADLSFYPYLKYLYYYKDNTEANPVMVTSSNLSGMKVFNAIQAGVYKKNEINANLTSTQWSTHARSLAFLNKAGVNDKKSVLPGGAIQDIDMGNKGDTQIGVTLWQACLPDTQVQAVQEGFKVSETEARTAVNALVEEIKKSISGYGLVQWGEVGTYTDFRSIIDSGEELHESTSVSLVTGNSGITASDDKYYLRHDGSGSSRANFDVLDSRIENQFVYTIYSDTEGNVWVTKDGTELGRISKTEDASKLLQNAELKLLDDNTKLITNYISCIQRNIGNARDGSTWHNEAFDGVSVLMTDISFDVGFGGDSSKRTNVLDPLLVAKAQSKSDLYNFEDESNIRSSVYVTTKTSSQAEKSDQEGYLGTLKAVSGMGDLETGLTDIQSMVYTKNFYITNATVSDLN